MIKKEYGSFDEINQDLRILNLQRQIDKEQLKLSFQQTKMALYPTQLLGGFKGIAQKLLLTLVVKKITEKLG